MTKNWLPRALEESRARGFLGPGPIDPQIMHSLGFALCWEERIPEPPVNFLDLGSGGGLPGLVLLERWNCRGVFLDSMVKRMNFLREVLEDPEAPSDSEVLTGRSEVFARNMDLEAAFDLVTARSFGPPAVTAECSARFLKVDGLLVVSEPPNDEDVGRWDEAGLAKLGLRSLGRVRHGAAYQVLVKVSGTSIRYPREVGVPKKKPLF